MVDAAQLPAKDCPLPLACPLIADQHIRHRRIVDGFVHWASFLRDFLDIYHAWIRGPLSWTVHVVWPSAWPKIPLWICDLFVVWSTFFLAANISMSRFYGESLWKQIRKTTGVPGAIFALLFLFFITLLFLFSNGLSILSSSTNSDLQISRNAFKRFFVIIASVIVLLFLNWQIQRI
jgi:hypothetical protein